MLGRRRRTTPIELAVAQRRLAALGRHFERESAASSDEIDADSRPDEPLGVVTPQAPRWHETSHGGRHLSASGSARREAGRDGLTEGRSYVVLAVVVIAVVVTLSVWVVLRSLSRPAPIELTTREFTPSATDGSSPSSETAMAGSSGSAAPTIGASQTVVVDVTGKVRKPGIVELPVGSRVVNALRAAGGVQPGVRTASLNLARVLVDGEQIVVGYRVPAPPAGSSSAAGSTPSSAALAPINLNTATQQQLEALPDVGPVTAAAILQYKAEHGQYTSVDELLDVSGIGDATLANIRPYVYV
jgi:competence protein ComEA